MFFDRLAVGGYVCAHRGARALAPENTMFAAERCLALGADFWEMDVHKTADGELVVFHDDVLDRTTNVASLPEFADRAPWPTKSFTLDELHQLDAGSWFISADPYGTVASGEITPAMLEQIRGQRILTLHEALVFTRQNNLPMNLEIKDQKDVSGDLKMIEDILHLIYDLEVEDYILISSFNHEYLQEVNRLAMSIPRAVLVEDGHPDNLVKYLKKLGATGYHPEKSLVDADLVRMLTENGINVTPYTVNNMDEAMSLIEVGCFGITTDYTHSLRQQISRRMC